MVRGNKKLPAAKPRATRPSAGSTEKNPPSKESSSSVPLDLQQKCLDIFQRTLNPGEDDAKTLQEVKGHLYNRDFATAFGKEEYLRVYASRWSPSRALGYVQVFDDVNDMLLGNPNQGEDSNDRPYRAVCLGGGAGAEVVALGAWMQLQTPAEESWMKNLRAHFVDIASWQNVVDDLHRAVTTPPELSKYASAAAKEANAAMVPGDVYSAGFHLLNVLTLGKEQCQELLQDVDLVTLMFTLNELYSTSMIKTQQMLGQITHSLRPGAHLLVVDSPGSYSTVSINGAEKKYPMQWLLDHTLIGSQQKGKEADAHPAKWEKLVSDDSKWYRLPQELKYPIELENMRYQIHLYRRLPD